MTMGHMASSAWQHYAGPLETIIAWSGQRYVTMQREQPAIYILKESIFSDAAIEKALSAVAISNQHNCTDIMSKLSASIQRLQIQLIVHIKTIDSYRATM